MAAPNIADLSGPASEREWVGDEKSKLENGKLSNGKDTECIPYTSIKSEVKYIKKHVDNSNRAKNSVINFWNNS